MVQRKVADKLGIQADHIKVNNKPVASLKPSTLQQHQDVKSGRGADLKKKMKKSGKTKHSEFENLRSQTLRRHVLQPGKPPPPPLTPLVLPSSPQKLRSCPIRDSSNSTPNYMKSTSSSDARKEKSQVSSRSPQSVSSTYKSSGRKNSNTSKSGHNPARTLARTTSLKLVRALTKTPSFKPARVSSKKCSQVVLCENLDVQRATCSSTLKDSKFPCYLEINPGGTEAQGTSAMKVCPYTYCSLNGHHHLPLPPLKCFLSARRRSMKAQRSLKIGCLSPRRARPCGLSLAGDGPDQQEAISSEVSPLRPEENMEFTIEIYCKEREDMAAVSAGSTEAVNNHGPSNSSQTDPKPTHCSNYAQDEVQENRDFFHVRDSSAEEGEDICPASMAPEESGSECLSEDHGFETDSVPNQPYSEDSDMDWEGLEYSAFYIDTGAIDSLNHNQDTDLEVYGSDKKVCYVIQDESTLKPDDETICSLDESLAKNILQESFDEESMTSGAWLSDDDTQSSISCADSIFCEYVEVSTGCDHNPDTHIEDDNEITQTHVHVSDEQTEEAICRDCSVSHGENMILPEDDLTALIGYQESNDSHDFVSSENNTEPNLNDTAIGEVPVEKIHTPLEGTGTEQACSELQIEGQHNAGKLLFEEAGVKIITSGDDTSVLDTAPNGSKSEQASAGEGLTAQSSQEEPETSEEGSQKAQQNGCVQEVYNVEKELTAGVKTQKIAKVTKASEKQNADLELPNLKRTIRHKKHIEEEELREFNPRAPNFLPLEPDPEAERVDLKHQMIDERKNAEEWMVDYALRQTVSKLAPARRKKVALLVEAFETVAPIPKYESHLRHSTKLFPPTRSIQACS